MHVLLLRYIMVTVPSSCCLGVYLSTIGPKKRSRVDLSYIDIIIVIITIITIIIAIVISSTEFNIN